MAAVDLFLRGSAEKVVLFGADAAASAAGGVRYVEIFSGAGNGAEFKDFVEGAGSIFRGRVRTDAVGFDPVRKVKRGIGWANENIKGLQILIGGDNAGPGDPAAERRIELLGIVMIFRVNESGQADLLLVVEAASALGIGFAAAQRWQEQAGEDSNNSYDDQQLNERKALVGKAIVHAKAGSHRCIRGRNVQE